MQLPYTKEDKVKSERSMYVQVKINGVEADNLKEKTKTVKSNGKQGRNLCHSFFVHLFNIY